MARNKIGEKMEEFNIEIAKQKMKDYTDFFGGQLSCKDEIDDAKTIFDLELIIEKHNDHIADMAIDAQSSLSRFKQSLNF